VLDGLSLLAFLRFKLEIAIPNTIPAGRRGINTQIAKPDIQRRMNAVNTIADAIILEVPTTLVYAARVPVSQRFEIGRILHLKFESEI